MRLTLELNDVDVENLIAFGNRAQMSGAEAEVWVRLKMGLIDALEAARAGADDPGIVTGLDPDAVKNYGGSA